MAQLFTLSYSLLFLCLVSVVDLQEPTENAADNDGADNAIDSEDPDNTQAVEDTQNTEDVSTADEQLQELELACPELSGQIIGGRASSINRHPYQVSMVLNGNSFCGGFIISRDYVMTAAHCVRGVAPTGVRLRVGSTRRDSGGRIAQVSNVIVHPLYGRPQFDNDIALLRLAQPLTFTRAIQPIRLPQVGQRVPLARLTVTGWGLTAVYEMFMIGYQFRVLSPIFTIHWGLQSRRYRPLWREKQNERNRKHFETFKRELFARYRKDPLHLLRKPPPPKKPPV